MVITGNIIRREESTIPNHVKNVLKFSNLKSEDRRFILDTITTAEEREDGLHHYIDFDLIIPEPKTKEECPADCLVNKDSHVMEDKERPWFDWYTWHNKYWNTKWNAYDDYIIATPGTITFVFSTAWCSPFPVIEKLKLLGYNFELKYADEDYGSNCGKMIYNPIKTGFEDIVHIAASDIANPEQFARRLWAKY